MYLHLGREIVVLQEDVVGLFDLDTSTWSKHTKRFLTAWEEKGQVWGFWRLCAAFKLRSSCFFWRMRSLRL